MKKHRKFNNGFTLIELMLVVAVLAILAAIAYPSYVEQIRKAHRADAKESLLHIATLLEQYYQENKGYPAAGDMTDVGLVDPYVTPEGYYNIQFSGAATARDYTLKATPVGDQVNDTDCYAFTLTSRGVRSNQDASSTTISNDRCW
jgi:type IV pilus assembly protein PilE